MTNGASNNSGSNNGGSNSGGASGNGHSENLLERVRQVRSRFRRHASTISARVQTVDARHRRFHRLLQTFERRTGCPVLINTSFNVRGEPIVCTPEEALRCFSATDMDVLVLERAVIEKTALPAHKKADRAAYLAGFQLD